MATKAISVVSPREMRWFILSLRAQQREYNTVNKLGITFGLSNLEFCNDNCASHQHKINHTGRVNTFDNSTGVGHGAIHLFLSSFYCRFYCVSHVVHVFCSCWCGSIFSKSNREPRI